MEEILQTKTYTDIKLNWIIAQILMEITLLHEFCTQIKWYKNVVNTAYHVQNKYI